MPRPELVAQAKARAPVFAALGDETRLRIVGKLSTRPHSIAQLTAGEKMSRQAVTKHLAVLAEAGIVGDERRGRERLFHLVPEPLDRARRYLELASAHWESALGRLRAFVED